MLIKLNKKKYAHISLRIPKDLDDFVSSFAVEKDCSKSEFIRFLIEKEREQQHK